MFTRSRPFFLKSIFRIYRILVRYRLDDILLTSGQLRFLRVFFLLNPLCWLPRPKRSRGERIRLALEALGPVYIKFGQILSTRRDLLPDDIAEQLAQLQDNVPPFPGAQAKVLIEKAYRTPLDTLFRDFDPIPLASASIAQVHSATLQDGTAVVIKVLRPEIKQTVARDMSLLHTCAQWAERFWPLGQHLKPKALVDEFEDTLRSELDLMREAANASQLRRNFQNETQLSVPAVHWPLTRTQVMVMEKIDGLSLTNIPALKAHGFNLPQLAAQILDLFFTQVFRDSFFHADMHAGNIFVARNSVEQPQYLLVDLGIVGALSSHDQRYIAENLLAFFKRDYKRVAELHIESGWVPAQTRIDAFESSIRTVCEPIFERPLKEISFAQMLLQLIQTARDFKMDIQPQLLLLQKTLLNVEGLGRQLDPELNLWNTAKPFLENWVRQRVSLCTLVKKLKANAPYWSEKMPELPQLLYHTLLSGRSPTPASTPPTTLPPPRSNNTAAAFCLGFLLCALLVAIVVIFALAHNKMP